MFEARHLPDTNIGTEGTKPALYTRQECLSVKYLFLLFFICVFVLNYVSDTILERTGKLYGLFYVLFTSP